MVRLQSWHGKWGLVSQRIYELMIKILWKFPFLKIWFLITRSGYYFAHAMTALLSWHVQNYNLIDMIITFQVIATWIFIRYGLWTHKTFMKFVPKYDTPTFISPVTMTELKKPQSHFLEWKYLKDQFPLNNHISYQFNDKTSIPLTNDSVLHWQHPIL